MGDNSHLHHLHVWELEKVSGHRDVEAHAYSNGRYKVRIEPHDGKDHSHDEPTDHSIVLASDLAAKDEKDTKGSEGGIENLLGDIKARSQDSTAEED